MSLISEYEAHPELWDPRNSHFNVYKKRCEAWATISQDLCIPVEEVKKKMPSLLAYYKRERMKLVPNPAFPYDPTESKWFAYRAFSFLEDIPKTKESMSSENVINHYNIYTTTREECDSQESKMSVCDSQDGASQQYPETSGLEMDYSQSSGMPRSKQFRLKVKKRALEEDVFESRPELGYNRTFLLPKKKYEPYCAYLAAEFCEMDENSVLYIQKHIASLIHAVKTGKIRTDCP